MISTNKTSIRASFRFRTWNSRQSLPGVRIDVSAALSDNGKVREHNEDHYFVASGGRHATTLLTNVPPGDVPSEFGETGYLMIVADGMGATPRARWRAGWRSPRS